MLNQLKAVFAPKTKNKEDDPLDAFFHVGKLVVDRLDPLPVDMTFFPQGWMTPLELEVLYNLGKHGAGDFVEIGTWIGRSTTAITLGRRDAKSTEGRRFDAVDYGFVSLPEMCEALNTGIEYAAKDEIARPILAPGGSMSVLMENLRSRGLLNQVTSVIRGNALEVPLRDSYGVIFCDATHSEQEISLTGPTLARIAKPGSWLICDDIHDHANLVSALEEHVQFDFLQLLAEIDPSNKAAIGRVKSTSVNR